MLSEAERGLILDFNISILDCFTSIFWSYGWMVSPEVCPVAAATASGYNVLFLK